MRLPLFITPPPIFKAWNALAGDATSMRIGGNDEAKESLGSSTQLNDRRIPFVTFRLGTLSLTFVGKRE